jgi:hypothetical protein
MEAQRIIQSIVFMDLFPLMKDDDHLLSLLALDSLPPPFLLIMRGQGL